MMMDAVIMRRPQSWVSAEDEQPIAATAHFAQRRLHLVDLFLIVVAAFAFTCAWIFPRFMFIRSLIG
jgi:hypothetical protein